MKKHLLFLVLLSFLIPSVTFAAWWNPLSWFNGWGIKKEKIEEVKIEKELTEKTEQEEKEKINTGKDEIEELKKEIENLKKQTTNISNEKPMITAPANKTQLILEQIKKEQAQEINYQTQKDALKESKDCKKAIKLLEENKEKGEEADKKVDIYEEKYKKDNNDHLSFLKYMEYSRESTNLSRDRLLLLSGYYRFCEGSSVLPEIPKVYNTTCYDNYGGVSCTTY